MSQFTTQWLLDRERRMGAVHRPPLATDAPAAEDELRGIHAPILAWCARQQPQPAIFHCRPDRASGVTKGAPDFVIFFRGHVYLIECKDREGKVSADQQIWHHLAELNGFPVHIVRSYQQFLDLVTQQL